MKILFFIALGVITLNASNFRMGLNTQNYQNSEGSALVLFYKLNNTILLETSYNEFYLKGIKNNSNTESWNRFNTQRAGIRYYLKSYSNDEIKLFTSVGIEYIYKNTDLSTNKRSLNTYGLFGLDLKVNKSFDITFAFGSSGKGDNANKIKSNPNYAHGFNSIVGIEYKF